MHRRLDLDILTALGDDDESFSLLHQWLVSERGHFGLSVGELEEALRGLERRGALIEGQAKGGRLVSPVSRESRERALAEYAQLLPAENFESVEVDEFGLWYSITPWGRQLWRHLAHEDEEQTP